VSAAGRVSAVQASPGSGSDACPRHKGEVGASSGGQSGGLSPGEERVRPADGDGGPDSDGLCDVDMEEIMRRARSDAEAAWEGTGPVPEMLVRIRALMLLRKAQRGEPL
jgi:hypothetical protein